MLVAETLRCSPACFACGSAAGVRKAVLATNESSAGLSRTSPSLSLSLSLFSAYDAVEANIATEAKSIVLVVTVIVLRIGWVSWVLGGAGNQNTCVDEPSLPSSLGRELGPVRGQPLSG